MYDIDKERKSLVLNLTNNNYTNAFQKITTSITKLCNNIQLLQDYSLKIGSKSDNKEKSEKIDKIILDTADLFENTFILIKEITEFDFKIKSEKIENITEANKLKDKCNEYQKKYEDITKKIKAQNRNLIRRASRTSYQFSFVSISDFGNGGNDNDDNIRFKNGNEFLEGLESKHKQNNAIEKAEGKMNYIRNSINNMNNDNDNINGNKVNSFIQKEFMRMESMDLKRMESKVNYALKGPQGNFISRNYKMIILLLIIIMIFIMFICF